MRSLFSCAAFLGPRWGTPAFVGAMKGLSNAKEWSIKVDNCMALRGPSEAQTSRRAPAVRKLDDTSPKAANAMIGLRALADGSPRLTRKLNKRKNLRAPAPLNRRRVWGEDSFFPNIMCRIRDFRTLVSSHPSNQMLMTDVQKSNMRRAPKALRTRVGRWAKFVTPRTVSVSAHPLS